MSRITSISEGRKPAPLQWPMTFLGICFVLAVVVGVFLAISGFAFA
jgi:hypothetical protein